MYRYMMVTIYIVVMGEDEQVEISSGLASEPRDSLVLALLDCLWGGEEMESWWTFLTIWIWTWRSGGTRMVWFHCQGYCLSWTWLQSFLFPQLLPHCPSWSCRWWSDDQILHCERRRNQTWPIVLIFDLTMVLATRSPSCWFCRSSGPAWPCLSGWGGRPPCRTSRPPPVTAAPRWSAGSWTRTWCPTWRWSRSPRWRSWTPSCRRRWDRSRRWGSPRWW